MSRTYFGIFTRPLWGLKKRNGWQDRLGVYLMIKLMIQFPLLASRIIPIVAYPYCQFPKVHNLHGEIVTIGLPPVRHRGIKLGCQGYG